VSPVSMNPSPRRQMLQQCALGYVSLGAFLLPKRFHHLPLGFDRDYVVKERHIILMDEKGRAYAFFEFF